MSAYSRTVLQDGPIAYWRLGERSGTNFADQMGTAAGTLLGTVSQGVAGAIAGDNDGAVANGGANNCGITLASAAALNLAGSACSLEAWFRLNASGNSYVLIGAYNANTPFEGYGLASLSGQICYWSGGGNSGNWLFSNTTINGGGLFHVVFSVSATQTIGYVNGAVDVTQNGDLRPTSWTGARLLGTSSGQQFSWNGMFDEVAIYGTALSAARVKAHYKAGIAGGVLVNPVGNSPCIRGRAAA